jgi:Zn-dependent peptidase ImmA (M78 family)
MVDIINNARKMLECGELRVIFKNFDGNFTGTTLTNNGQTVIVLNSNLSYEYNLHKFLHEIMHIEHLNTNLDIKECEKKAIEFEKNPIALQNLMNIAE